MKKYIILAILSATTFINGQSSNMFFWYDDTTNTSWEGVLKGNLFYTDLNGTTQSWSKTTPVGLDLNGAEMVPKDSNSTFESGDTTDWTGNGTHSIDTSGTRKYAGSYAGKVISTGVGDTTTNFISLAYNQFQPIVAGKKYTVEYWANAVGKEGTATYTSNFGSGVDGWGSNGGVITGGATISDGSTSMDSVLTFGGNGSNTFANPRKSGGLGQNATNTYMLKFWYLIPTSNDTCVHMAVANAVAYTYSGYNVLQTVKGTWTYVELKIKMVASTAVSFVLRKTDTTTPSTWDSLYLANITLTPIIQPTYTLKIGTKSVTSDTISVIPGVFEKVVYNFQATSAEVNTPIKIYCSQADTGWIDNFSIREAYDFSKWAWIKSSATGTNKMIAERFASNNGLKLSINTSNQLVAVVGDGTNTVTKTGTATNLCNGSWHLVGLTASRTGNLQLYVDGVADGTATAITSLGSIVSTTAFQIGFLSADYFNGSIGEIQRIRHTDLALVDKTPAQIYQRGKNRVHFYDSYTGGTIVGWWFRTATSNDASSSANNLTETGSPTVSTLTTSY